MLCIKNGMLVSSSGVERKDLWIHGGKIVERPETTTEAETIDAAGCYVFPGFIDSHTHLQMDAGATWTADDFASGTAAALAGGTTTILDFATQDRGGSLAEALALWHSRAEGNCSCDYGFHMAVTDWNEQTRRELADMTAAGVTSFKAYMAYDNLRLTDDALRELLKETAALGALVGVHCELGDVVNANVKAHLEAGHTEPKWHPLSRPNSVEAQAVERFLELAQQAEAPAWVVHLSTREGLKKIREAAAKGQKILTETCPQYVTLTNEVYITEDFEGAKFVCSPPIRSSDDKAALLEACAEGAVDIISTDHCSFNFNGQKELGRGNFSKIPNGLPGIEHRPALIWSCCGLTPERFCQLLSEKPARAFGMYPRKGSLLPGADADVVIWDPALRWTIRAAEQKQKVDYSPWEGFVMTGGPRTVLLHGEEGPGRGEFVHRGIPRL